MKRFLATASRSNNQSPSQSPADASRRPRHEEPAVGDNSDPPRPHLHAVPGGITWGGQHKTNVASMSHPCPHDYMMLMPSKEGLFIQPQVPERHKDAGCITMSAPLVRMRWGKEIVIEEVDPSTKSRTDAIWTSDGLVVYGIVGVLELFSCSYLLVITSRTNVGHVLDPSHTIYAIKNVAAIPLAEERAKAVLNTIKSQNLASQRSSLLPRALTLDLRTPLEDSPHRRGSETLSRLDPQAKSGLKVHFTQQDADKEEGHNRTSFSPQSSTSDLSTRSLDEPLTSPASPVIQAIVPRLSFWNKVIQPAQSLSQTLLPLYAKKDQEKRKAYPSTSSPPLLGEELRHVPEELERAIHEKKEEPSEVLKSVLAAFAPQPATAEERHAELETKIVRECIRQFAKGEMYFSYSFDITRSLQHKQERLSKSRKEYSLLAELDALPSAEPPNSSQSITQRFDRVSASSEPYPTLPLWRRVDRQFWWNEWLSKPFIDAGLHGYVLPVMQGYFQAATFRIPPDPPLPSSMGGVSPAMAAAAQQEAENVVEYTIISRRSKDRAGLRYQRRGIDDESRVANFVETETIMNLEREGRENVFSYVEIRGSIPLYWTQHGYGLKPPPMLSADRTHGQNMDALRRHFRKMVAVYGPHMIVNLAEQTGKEGVITKEYKECVQELNSKDVTYHEYDFHAETRGMKYENITKLTNAMERTFDSQAYLWISDGLVFSKQKAVYRVNCIDCLDRTNVVQSAFARYMLDKQLSALAIVIPLTDKKTEIDVVFNNVWANNGDAISRAYAGTSALKGDFTRTGKRDLGGMLNDGVNSLARMYSSTFSDWFCQAVIDYMLGNRTITVFSEFLLKLQSTDPSDLVRLSKIRAEAIATSVSRVLPEGERLLSGWTLFAPEDLNMKVGMKFEEKVLLLSATALYIISYDYTLEEVKMYTRVPVVDIIRISKGAYILSPLEEVSRDPEENAGFVVTWLTSGQESRISSYSVENAVGDGVSPFAALARSMSRLGRSRVVYNHGEQTFGAFKVLQAEQAGTCREAVELMVESIASACLEGGGEAEVVGEDVVGVVEAQKMTSVYAKMEYGVKRMLWLGG